MTEKSSYTIDVQVETRFVPDQSKPGDNRYVFAYTVTLRNAGDMPARLLFARYINFNRDKSQRPEILCWPGAWFAGDSASDEGMAIFDRNRALFVDKEHDDGIFPAVLADKDPEIVHDTFNKF